jgi:hypothetical protein
MDSKHHIRLTMVSAWMGEDTKVGHLHQSENLITTMGYLMTCFDQSKGHIRLTMVSAWKRGEYSVLCLPHPVRKPRWTSVSALAATLAATRGNKRIPP